MSDTAHDRALLLLADRDAVCAHIDAVGARVGPAALEHREDVDRQLAALVPDLLVEMEAGAAVPQ